MNGRRAPEKSASRTHMDHPNSSPIVKGTDHGRFRYALELSHLKDGMFVVDWGCAHGWFASLIAQRCPESRVLACDIPYPHGVPEFEALDIDFHLLDERAPRLPIDDGRVDRVYALDVLEHMGEGSRMAALAEMRRILKPDGLLVLTVPHRGLFHWTDVENVRVRFPRLHRFVFKLLRGGQFYEDRYGTNHLANFSADAEDHHHYSEGELVGVLRHAGFAPGERRFFGALYLVPWSMTMLLEALRRATGRRLEALERAASSAHHVAADIEPPRRLADSVGIAAHPRR